MSAYEAYKMSVRLDPTVPATFGRLIASSNQACEWGEHYHELRANFTALLAKNASVASVGMWSLEMPFLPLPFMRKAFEAETRAAAKFAAHQRLSIARFDPPESPELALPAEGRLNVALLSSDLHLGHPVGQLLIPQLRALDPARVRTLCMSVQAVPEVPSDVAGACSVYRSVTNTTADRSAATIREHAPHILVDLNGWSAGGRSSITVLHPAPVLVSFLGSLATSGGLSDYYLTDRESLFFPAVRELFTEKVAVLPENVMSVAGATPLTAQEKAQRLPRNPAYPAGSFVFCSWNRHGKLDPSLWDVYMTILHRVPTSVLWMLNFPTKDTEPRLRAEALKRGIGAERLIFSPMYARADARLMGNQCDLMLDAAVYNAVTTAVDSIVNEIPFLTWASGVLPTQRAGLVF
jgi:protein O-GlcNAc transferase